MSTRRKFYLANGFHNTETFILAAPGELIPEERLRRAGKRLCPSSDCRCTGSAASRPREDQRTGYEGDPGFALVHIHETPYELRPTGAQLDDAVIVPASAVEGNW